MNTSGNKSDTYWFVGAYYRSTGDQTPRFIENGIWENGYQDKYTDIVKMISVGDRIAIKSTYVRSKNLPFDNRGHAVSVMAIKAIGVVTKNSGDGRTLEVDWKPCGDKREWYFYTNRRTVWKVEPGKWEADALIDFTFKNEKQEIEPFQNSPFWRERFGENIADNKFSWTTFYESVANKLLDFRSKRDELVAKILDISTRVKGLDYLKDRFSDDSSDPLTDICPFTVMGTFNRKMQITNRISIARELAKMLGVKEPPPESFEGVPLLFSLQPLFFTVDVDKRNPDDIDALWEVFEQALKYTEESDSEESEAEFISSYDNAIQRSGVGWKLTIGLYWIQPWNFLSLDSRSRNFISDKLRIQIPNNRPNGRCSATDYLEIIETLKKNFLEDDYPVHSFPELSLKAFHQDNSDMTDQEESDEGSEIFKEPSEAVPYSIEQIISDGSFIERERLEEILESLEYKKNLILQGPPGTGKTWLAKKLGYALISQKDDSKVKVVQFHPNLSYEDFIRGWRPTGEGKLDLIDGPFVEMIMKAKDDPASKYVIIIEEINRGNPAQIFGEMLTLLESDKRKKSESIELSYKRSGEEGMFIPENLYVIGTMNIADRSLALVDLALRRRFAFIDLEPTFGQLWRDCVIKNNRIEENTLNVIKNRLINLNKTIEEDTTLGPQFKIGHSYVTPAPNVKIPDGTAWFRRIVEREIGPLLEEYWYDDRKKAKEEKEKLLEGF